MESLASLSWVYPFGDHLELRMLRSKPSTLNVPKTKHLEKEEKQVMPQSKRKALLLFLGRRNKMSRDCFLPCDVFMRLWFFDQVLIQGR